MDYGKRLLCMFNPQESQESVANEHVESVANEDVDKTINDSSANKIGEEKEINKDFFTSVISAQATSDDRLLKNIEENGILASYDVVNGETEKTKSKPHISAFQLNRPNQIYYINKQNNLANEKVPGQMLCNKPKQNLVSTDNEHLKIETSQQTEMSVHIKGETSPQNLTPPQSSPKENLTANIHYDFRQDNPEVLEKLKKLDEIRNDAKQWADEITKFDGDHKTFLHIQEMLLRDIDEVDLVYAEGKDIIKQTKKEIIVYVYEELNKLETMNKKKNTTST